MTDDVKAESSAAAREDAPRPKKPRAKKPAADDQERKAPVARRGSKIESTATSTTARKTAAKSRKTEPEAKTEPVTKAAPKKKSAAKRKSKATEKAAEAAPAPQIAGSGFEDPIGDVSDGEARTYTGEAPETDAQREAEAYRAGVAVDAVDGTPESPVAGAQAGVDEEPTEDLIEEPDKIAEEAAKNRERTGQAGIRPPAKLERLQKILSQAGIASRRHAEEMIVAGRVEVNGKVVTVLGSKADPERDHIRVDGKLLHGAERHRYFLLNKPKGYVTTVSDPEGRPTVMDFVRRLGERVYPVGRLDFQSEGLLLMTNDGALANQLTHASSGVEKTYVVKVSGQPDEEELERLRNGVMIERGGPSSSGLYGPGGRVRTAPAQIRQIRPGENPWYEVVLTEGRNREIRKMFSAIGHYAEKIRRVGYGPLALDVEPGKLRELTLEEVDLLRQVSEGKLKPRRLKSEAMLPKEAGRSAESRPEMRGSRRPLGTRPANTRSARPHEERLPERGRGNEFRGRGNEFRRRGDDSRGGGDNFSRRGEQKFGSRSGSRSGARFGAGSGTKFASRTGSRTGYGGGTPREFRGERREWQPRPREERPTRGRPAGFQGNEPRRGFGESRRTFDRPGQTQTGGPQMGKPHTGKPEDREFGTRSNRPGSRWQSNVGERPFRPEARAGQGGGGGSRSGRPPKFAAEGRPGNRNPLRSNREEAGRERFTGERGRDRAQSSSRPKPDHFRTGPRPGGRTGQRPGGQRAGGRRRGQ